MGAWSPELWVGLVLIAIITFSTTANIAVTNLSRVKLSERLNELGRGELLHRLMDYRPELMISTSIVRISAMICFVLLTVHLFGFSPSEPWKQYSLVFVISTFIVLIFGVGIPNAWARYQGDAFTALMLPLLLGLRYALYPLVAFLHLFDGLVRRLAGIPKDEEEKEADKIEKEILGVVSEGELAGAVHEEDAEMIESVIEFRSTQVGEIMTPRTEIVAISADTTFDDARHLIAARGHSRIPVYGENVDDIRGVLYAKDLLNLDNPAEFNPLEMMREVPFVPETKLIPDLLREFRTNKVHVAIVLDEYGGTAGLVTIEDILEEIVGEIADEYEESEPEAIRRIDDHTLEIDARVHIDELNEELQIELPDDEDYDTVGGFLFSTMGKIPSVGEEYSYQNVRFRVLDAEARKINRLRVEVMPDEAPAQ